MSIETLIKSDDVTQSLEQIRSKQEASGFLGAIGIRTDDHDCTMELSFQIIAQEGEDDPCLCLVANYTTESDEVDEESFRLEQIADSINDDLSEASSSWSQEQQDALENLYGVCIMVNGKQLY